MKQIDDVTAAEAKDEMNHFTENLNWIKQGNAGCTFAAFFARHPDMCGWKYIESPEQMYIPESAMILSILFPNKTKLQIRHWALQNGFYEEKVDEGMVGLRYKIGNNTSWVQYMGPDADVATRTCPVPMLMMCVKKPHKYYPKVGFKGILHLAHASVEIFSKYVSDRLWDSSHRNTKKILGHTPSIKEAAKTTFHG